MPPRLIAFAILCASLAAARAQSVPPDLLDFYKDLHAHPELSHHISSGFREP